MISADRLTQAKITPAYEKRRQVAKSIAKFWPVALMNHSHFAFFAQHSADQLALSYLEDLWIARDPVEPRCYTIEFVRCLAVMPILRTDLAAYSISRKTRSLPTPC